MQELAEDLLADFERLGLAQDSPVMSGRALDQAAAVAWLVKKFM